jgi:hypothetical protein
VPTCSSENWDTTIFFNAGMNGCVSKLFKNNHEQGKGSCEQAMPYIAYLFLYSQQAKPNKELKYKTFCAT